MRRIYFLIPALLVLAADQTTKFWCSRHLQESVPKPFVDRLLYLNLVYNTRGAFGIFPFHNLFFVIVTVIFLGVLFFYAAKSPLPFWQQGVVGLLCGGGVGNLLDRIRLGYVVDFLDLRYWPVFNLADASISVAIAIIVLRMLFKPREKTRMEAPS